MALVIAYPTPTVAAVAQPVTSIFRVIQGTHDGYSANNSTAMNTSAATLVTGDISSTLFDFAAVALLTPDAANQIPKAKTLQTAKLIVTQGAGRSGSFETRVAFEAADNPTFPTSKADHQARVRGTAFLWDTNAAWVTGTVIELDVKTQIQAIVNRTGYAPGNRIQFLWDHSSTTGAGFGVNDNHQLTSFDSNPDQSVRLEVTYLP